MSAVVAFTSLQNYDGGFWNHLLKCFKATTRFYEKYETS